MTIVQTVILSIVEGITEFLPISSTGHMIIASGIMGINGDEFTKIFTVAVQLGAILSVVVLYWKRFFQTWDFYYKLFIAFIPIAIVGLLLKKMVDASLGNVLIVACSLVIGGIILLFVDQWFSDSENSKDKTIEPKNAFLIGLFQIIALIPGVSRSAATIIGGLTQKLNKKQAAEFAFFLSVPTLAELFSAIRKTPEIFTRHNILLLLIGNIIAFVVALFAIRSFIGYLTKHGFRVFGIYRIIIGLIIIGLVYFHFPLIKI
jgi:undecaprenyl-diphosphatase